MGLFDFLGGGEEALDFVPGLGEILDAGGGGGESFLSGLPDFIKDPKFITAGLVTTGSMLSNLFGQQHAEALSEKAYARQKEELDLMRKERERDRMIQLQLAAIQQRAAAGQIRPNTEGYHGAAQAALQGASTEQGAIGNLIGSYRGIL